MNKNKQQYTNKGGGGRPFSPSYTVRLRIFGLKTLGYRSLELDLIICFKIVKGFCALNFGDFFSWAAVQSRGLDFRVVRSWNLLPEGIVSERTPAAFASRLRNFHLSFVAIFRMQISRCSSPFPFHVFFNLFILFFIILLLLFFFSL